MTETWIYDAAPTTFAEPMKVFCHKCRHVITEAVLVRYCEDGVHRWFCEACAA